MPPRKYKTDHRRGGGSKHISSADDVQARNKGEETAYDKARRGIKADGAAPEEGSSSGEEVEEEAQKSAEKAKVSSAAASLGLEVANPNAVRRNEEKEGVELTRKQREEIEKANARRRYEELHKAGKTDEAKADLARLEEVKKRREETAMKKAQQEADAKAKEAAPGDAKAIGKAALTAELKAVMGETSRKPGDKSKKASEEKKDDEAASEVKDAQKKKLINGVEESDMYSFVSTSKKPDASSENKANKGTIEACRAAEDDFM